jgi:ubiquinone/menaquinone biosynthesis C-methylase UbiE
MPLPVTYRELERHYEGGGNVLRLLREVSDNPENTAESILTAYDLQAGSYVGAMEEPAHRASILRYAEAIAVLLRSLSPVSLLEVGVGEATTMAHVVERLTPRPSAALGLDISWSRILMARRYAARQHVPLSCFVGDLFAMPLADDSVDVVYTSHSIEPNRGRERAALEELHRVARRFVVLIEPAATFGSAATKERIRRHGYCANLAEIATELGYEVREHRLFDVSTSPENESELTLIEKAPGRSFANASIASLACPLCRTLLIEHAGHLFCDGCCRVFPKIVGIPCLTRASGILAGKYLLASDVDKVSGSPESEHVQHRGGPA